jgi:NADPH:quinone reductase-like Zn-dependent oxidoreductase
VRAYAVESFGQAPNILDLPIPAAEGAILIRVRYAGVNPIDYKLADRLTAASPFPFVFGADFAGVVERVPAGEKTFRAGDRIFGMARTHGAYCEYTAVVPAAKLEPLAHIPDGVTDEQAAALPIPAVTALGSLELVGASKGQLIVVMGAAGGVGGYAVQMARARGVRVIATVRGDADEARKLGAEEVYDAKTGGAGDVIDAIHNAHPEGVDAVIDLVNPANAIGRDAEMLKPGGTVVSTIYAADEKWFAERKLIAHNIAGNANPFSTPDGLARIANMLADGTITARVQSAVALDCTAQIIEKLRTGGLRGKAVIRL